MIKLDEDAILGSKEKYTMTEENDFLESYFRTGIENASEFSGQYSKISSDLYKSLNENVLNSITIFTTFYNDTKNIFEKYISRMNDRSYNQFSSALKRRLREDRKETDHFRRQLSNYSGKDIQVTVTRYNYSNLYDTKIPSIKLFESFSNERYFMDVELKSCGDEGKKKIIESELSRLIDYIRSGECYNNARAIILDSNKPIEAQDYSKAIFDVFRSGGDQVVEYTITAKQIREITERFYKYENALKSIDMHKKEISKMYNYLLSHLENYDLARIKDMTFSEDILMKYDTFIKLKTDQLIHYCALYITAFDGKIDALANSYMQDRDLLLKLCGYISSNKEKEEEQL